MHNDHGDPPPNWIGNETAFRLDDDRYIMWCASAGLATNNDGQAATPDTAIGIMEWHWDGQSAHWCGGWVGFVNRGVREGHTLESTNPLTISPSLLCSNCPDHGWIRSGRWVSA